MDTATLNSVVVAQSTDSVRAAADAARAAAEKAAKLERAAKRNAARAASALRFASVALATRKVSNDVRDARASATANVVGTAARRQARRDWNENDRNEITSALASMAVHGTLERVGKRFVFSALADVTLSDGVDTVAVKGDVTIRDAGGKNAADVDGVACQVKLVPLTGVTKKGIKRTGFKVESVGLARSLKPNQTGACESFRVTLAGRVTASRFVRVAASAL